MSERIEFLKKTFTLIPEGTYVAVLAQIEDVGLKPMSKDNPTKVQKSVMWFQTEPVEVEEGGAVIERRFTLRGGFEFPKAISTGTGHFKKFIAPLLDKDELEGSGIAPEELIGRNLTVQVQHTTKDGITYANIVNAVPVPSKKRYDLKVSEDYKPRGEDMNFPPKD